MINQNIIKSLIASSFLIFLVIIVGKVYSQNLEISGNASDSNNSININQTESNTVNQSNTADVDNNVNAESVTGGNSINDGVGGGSIKTGDATTNVNINNQFNTNVADINCKDCPTPTPKPSPAPTDPPVGGLISDPASVPSGNGGNGGNGDGGGGGSSAGGPGQGGEVLGLSSTSGDKSLLGTITGFLFIFLGYTLVRLRPVS